MTIEVKTPALPESVADAVVAAWHKQEGDQVHQDENLVDIETDKVVLEVPAPQSGILKKIQEREGATVVAGQLLALVDPSGAAKPAAKKAPKSEPSVEASQPPAEAQPPVQAQEAAAASPSVRKMLQEHDLGPDQVQGTGKGGRILKEDVVAYLQQGGAQGTGTPGPMVEGERPQRRVPMTRLRARIAERLVQAQQTAAMLTTFNEVNMQPVMDLRNRYKEPFEKQYGVRLGFMSFFVRAAVEALKRFPEVNASIDGQDIVYHGFYDIGVAVSSPRGLVVPVVRDADRLSMANIEERINDYGRRAQEGRLEIDDLTGGTFTISNGGVFGSLLSTPILNPPQTGILGMHKIEQRPVVEGGEIVARPMMYLALSYDHRLIDGASAVRFLVALKEMLEDPARILLEL